MSHLRIALFGGFEASLDTQPLVDFGADKARGLLAYLAVESNRPHRRDELAALLWPDSTDARAAHNLSQTLLRLRRALGAAGAPTPPRQQPLLLITNRDIQFNPLGDHWLDVAEFAELIRARRQHQHQNDDLCPLCLGWLKQAANLYRGELLAGFSLRDSVPFEEWQVVQQEMLHMQAVEALASLAAYHERRGEPQQTQEFARRLAALEPWHEPAQLMLIAALAASGQTAVALEQYNAFSRLLAAEFGATPSPSARGLHDRIRAHAALRDPGVAAGQAAAPGEERRQVTVMVCGRRRAAAAGDPEDDLEALARCSAHCTGALARGGGQRQPRQGLTCLVYFGYPVAYEDAAQRAVRAGLEIAAAAGDGYSHAIGIDTGMMVSLPGEMGGEMVGEAPIRARACQQQAEAGSVWVTAATERLIRGWFDCQPGPGAVPAAFRISGEHAAGSRLAWLAQTQSLPPLVGREAEMQQLTALLQAAQQGKGQVVALAGEAGIGKSRLVWELKRVASPSVRWLETACTPHFQHTSLHPVIAMFQRFLDLQPGNDAQAPRAKLDDLFERLGLAQPTATWLLALLLDLPTEMPAPQTITEDQRQRMRLACVALLGRLAAQRPLVVVIEDLHWADPSTVAWLDASLDALTALPCLTLLTYRPIFTPPWRPRSRLTQLTLGPLNPGQAERLVDGLVGDKAVPAALRRRVVERADGVPLFVQELARALLESGAPAAASAIPATLHDSLRARLDRMGAAKVTAGWAAALGREFAYPVLAAVVPFDEPRLRADLATLTAAGLIQPTGAATATHYAFKHVLIQEAALGALLRRTRQAHHRRIAETYAARFPQIAETQLEVMAEHYLQAGLVTQAVNYWLKAGERATTQGATLEARHFFDRALDTIEPGDVERRWRALWGRETALCFRGERLAQKADIEALLALAEQLDDDGRRSQAHLRHARYVSSQADYRELAQVADAAIAAAQRAGRPALAVEALAYKVTALLRLGERSALRSVVAETLALAQTIGEDDIRSYAMAAVALYYFENGDLAHAAQILTQSLHAARRSQNRHLDLECQYHGHLGFAFAQLGLYSEARDALEAGLELANLTGIGRHQAYQMVNLGFVHWRSGDLATAIQMEEAALQEYAATGDAFGQAVCRAYLGYMHEEMGDLVPAAGDLAAARLGFAELGVEPDKIEAQATEARVLLALGQPEAARQLTMDVWEYLCEQGTDGFSSPAWVYVCVADVLAQVGNPGISAVAVLAAGCREVLLRADRISDAAWRRAFLHNVAENRAVMAAPVTQARRMNSASDNPPNEFGV
ncbi:MAG: AAA family ATPase [Anaerolineae bacterium]